MKGINISSSVMECYVWSITVWSNHSWGAMYGLINKSGKIHVCGVDYNVGGFTVIL